MDLRAISKSLRDTSTFLDAGAAATTTTEQDASSVIVPKNKNDNSNDNNRSLVLLLHQTIAQLADAVNRVSSAMVKHLELAKREHRNGHRGAAVEAMRRLYRSKFVKTYLQTARF